MSENKKAIQSGPYGFSQGGPEAKPTQGTGGTQGTGASAYGDACKYGALNTNTPQVNTNTNTNTSSGNTNSKAVGINSQAVGITSKAEGSTQTSGNTSEKSSFEISGVPVGSQGDDLELRMREARSEVVRTKTMPKTPGPLARIWQRVFGR